MFALQKCPPIIGGISGILLFTSLRAFDVPCENQFEIILI